MAPHDDEREEDTQRDSLLAIDQALRGSEAAVRTVAGMLAELAAGARLSQVEISERRAMCATYLRGLEELRAIVTHQLEG